jgi:hypothetical protein
LRAGVYLATVEEQVRINFRSFEEDYEGAFEDLGGLERIMVSTASKYRVKPAAAPRTSMPRVVKS